MSDIVCVAPEALDVSKISATELRKKNDQLRNILLYGNSAFYIETEWGRAPFGVRSFSGGEKTDYSLNISLTPDGDFVKKIMQLDEFMIDFAIENSMTIFKKKYTPAQKEVVRAMYTPSVKIAEDGDYPPRIAPKIQKKSPTDLTPQLLFYHKVSDDSEEVEEVEIQNFEQLVKLVPNGSRIKALISLKPWYISGRFGIAYTVQQLLVPKRTGGRPTTYAFNDKSKVTTTKVSAEKVVESIKGDESEDDAPEAEAEAEAESQENTDVVEDQEGEEEEEEEERPPTPKKVVKKGPAPAAAPAAKAAAPAKKPVAARK